VTTVEARRALIARIRAAGDSIRQAVDAVVPGKRRAAPSEAEWSVLETLVHLRNVVVMVHGLRIRRLIYEDDPIFADYDESAHRRAAIERPPGVDELVGMIVNEHEQIAALLIELPHERWTQKGRHPDLGEMSIELLARWVAEHAEDHATQIRKTANQIRDQARSRARNVAQEFLARGDVTGWFEPLYETACGDPAAIHWADLRANRSFLDWATRERLIGAGKKLLVVGCGVGDDAEAAATLGFEVIAFDVAPTAIDWCRQRFPASRVQWVTADVLAPPPTWTRAFDFVLEAFTIQVLTGEARVRAMRSIAGFVAPGGTLLVVARGRGLDEGPGDLPWPVTKDELSEFERAGLSVVRFEDEYVEQAGAAPMRRFRAEYRRSER
jgi:SAM-dependent methyltransferase